MNVTNLEAGTFTGKTTRPQRGNTTLVRDFRKRIGLIHELRQLARTKELFNRSRNRLGINEVVRHEVFGFRLTQTFFYSTFHTNQTGTELVLGQFAHATYATIAKVVDIVDLTTAVTQLNQDLDGFKNVFIGKRQRAGSLFVATQAAVDLHAADTRQIVRFLAVEQALEQGLNRVFGWRLARAHHAVNRNTRSSLICGIVGAQCLGNVCTTIKVIDVERFNFLDTGGTNFGHHGFSDFIIGAGNDFACIRVDNVLGQKAAHEKVFRHRQLVNPGRLQVAQVLGIDSLIFFDNDIAFFIGNVKARDFAFPALGNEIKLAAFVHDLETIKIEVVGQNFFLRHANGFEQNRYRHLATAVDTEE